MADAVPLPTSDTAMDRRLLLTGLPVLVANATVVVIPVLARAAFSLTEYAVFALLMTVVMAAGLLDLGGSAYVQSLGYGRATSTRQYAVAVGLAAAGAVGVTVVAAVAVVVVAPGVDPGLRSSTAVTLVVACGVASAARGAVAVLMSRLQVAERFTLRAAVALGQSVLQVAAFAALATAGAGLWSLPLAVGGGSAVALVAGHLSLHVRPTRFPSSPDHLPVARFAVFRTLSALMGAGSSQADRWVLAVVAGQLFLADYDLALRFAVLPGAVVGAVFVGIVAEAAAAHGAPARRALVARYTRRVAVTAAVLSVGTLAGVIVLGLVGLVPVTPRLVTVLVMALVWSGINAATAPTTFAFIGVGLPQAELRYAAPALLTAAAGWVLAVVLDNEWLVPVSLLLAVSGWSLWFIRYGARQDRA